MKITNPGADTSVGSTANDIGKSVDELMTSAYLLPAQRAALYQLMSRTPGFVIAHGVSTPRTAGTAIEWTFQAQDSDHLRSRHFYLPWRQELDLSDTHGGYTQAFALLKVAIGDKAGQVP